MTTTTTVAGRPLSGWTRDARHGTWHALLPVRSGEPVLGALRVDRALLAPEGTRERLAAAVLAVARLRLPGVLGTVDLVTEAGEVWLITARPPAPTLTDLPTRGGSGPDAGSAASVLNETAQSLLALHAAGLSHGTLGADTVVLAPDGVALLAEAALGTVLGDVPGSVTDSARREADVTAWAGLARTLGEAWAVPGTPAAALFARCSTTADSQGLAAARAALVAGRTVLPAGFLRRTELRAAVAATASGITWAPAADGTRVDARGVHPRDDRGEGSGPATPQPGAADSGAAGLSVAGLESEEVEDARAQAAAADGGSTGGSGAADSGADGASIGDSGAEGAGPDSAGTRDSGMADSGAGGASADNGAGAEDVEVEGEDSKGSLGTRLGSSALEGGGSGHTLPDEQLTMPSRTRSRRHQPHSAAASDDQATILGKRNRTPAASSAATPVGPLPKTPAGPLAAAPAQATAPSSVGEDDGGILLRFGPGVPLEAQDVLRAQWRTASATPDSRRPYRRRRRAWIATTAFLAAAAVLLWLLLRPSPAPTVTAVEVRAPAGRLHCGQTADLVGVVTTDGSGGAVTYHWLRSDGHDSGELVRMAPKGERRVTVHLRWTVRGPGSFRGTARLRITHQGKPSEAEATFSYACS
ncbi:hypothetical protein ACH4S8_31075 [Streptomyces sp. NPDC021080]|uniref:hypothetical protein n=1 Tax=Streptomyces sp. NPDC021080 TaxID=3365110 RepID=UPI0037958A3C